VVRDGIRCDPDPLRIIDFSEKVYILEEGLDRFSRVRAGRVYPEGPLIYIEQTFPLGPESEVLNALLDETPIDGIREVSPALEAAYRMEIYRRELAEKRRLELERIRREEEERKTREERRKQIIKDLGDGAVRRELARVDFARAARAALAIGGADLLDHRKATLRGNEWVVKYRVDGQRFECVCDTNLRIIDAGVCLTDHDIPTIIRQAIREHKLVVWRHV